MYLWPDKKHEWFTGLEAPENTIPWEWITPLSIQMTRDGYRDEGQTIEERVEQIANAFYGIQLEMGIPKDEAASDANYLFHMAAWGWNTFATPEWVSYGNDKGLSISCFGTTTEDSMNGLAELNAELAMLTKLGGGTSTSLSAIRARGEPISTGGDADGPIHWAGWINSTMIHARQGKARRGYCAAYLNGHHPDIKEFIKIGTISSDIHNITTGVNLDDSFLSKALYDKNYADKLAAIQESRSKIGFPYILFKDNDDRGRPQWYQDQKYTVEHSNLCVAPETTVLTKEGHIPIIDLAGDTVDVWNGEEWSSVEVVKTGENQKLVKVTLSDGKTVECTPYHKWYVMKRDSYSKYVEKRTFELKPDDKLIKFEAPVIEGDKELTKAYQNGFFSGDGCVVGPHDRIYLYGEKRSLREQFTDTYWHSVQEEQDREYFCVNGLKEKFFVPNAEYSVKSRLDWLEGVLDADGTVARNGESQTLQIASVTSGFLESIQMMLQTMGIQSKVVHAIDPGNYMLPANNGTGDLKEYCCQEVKRLLITGMGIVQLMNLGFSPKRLDVKTHVPNRCASHFVRVVDVSDEGRMDDSYCFTEHKRGMGVFNGVLTGQCSEIMLPNSMEESFVCVLASMNAVHYDQWKNTRAVKVLTKFLDTVVEESIAKIEILSQKYTKGSNFLNRIHTFLVRHRAIGLGITGLHHLYQSKMYSFESTEAARLNLEIFKHLKKETYEESARLGRLLGEPEVTRGYGMRNATTMAVAPTKSTAAILGNVSESIQPELANIFIKKLAKGIKVVKNPYLKSLLESKGKDTQEVWDSIKDNAGSVQFLSFLSEEEKAVFKTFAEINPRSLIDQAATRQFYIDQGQSLNLIYHPDVSSSYINALTYYAWKMGIKSLYYQFNMSAAQALNAGIQNPNECESCGS